MTQHLYLLLFILTYWCFLAEFCPAPERELLYPFWQEPEDQGVKLLHVGPEQRKGRWGGPRGARSWLA